MFPCDYAYGNPVLPDLVPFGPLAMSFHRTVGSPRSQDCSVAHERRCCLRMPSQSRRLTYSESVGPYRRLVGPKVEGDKGESRPHRDLGNPTPRTLPGLPKETDRAKRCHTHKKGRNLDQRPELRPQIGVLVAQQQKDQGNDQEPHRNGECRAQQDAGNDKNGLHAVFSGRSYTVI